MIYWYYVYGLWLWYFIYMNYDYDTYYIVKKCVYIYIDIHGLRIWILCDLNRQKLRNWDSTWMDCNTIGDSSKMKWDLQRHDCIQSYSSWGVGDISHKRGSGKNGKKQLVCSSQRRVWIPEKMWFEYGCILKVLANTEERRLIVELKGCRVKHVDHDRKE